MKMRPEDPEILDPLLMQIDIINAVAKIVFSCFLMPNFLLDPGVRQSAVSAIFKGTSGVFEKFLITGCLE